MNDLDKLMSEEEESANQNNQALINKQPIKEDVEVNSGKESMKASDQKPQNIEASETHKPTEAPILTKDDEAEDNSDVKMDSCC